MPGQARSGPAGYVYQCYQSGGRVLAALPFPPQGRLDRWLGSGGLCASIDQSLVYSHTGCFIQHHPNGRISMGFRAFLRFGFLCGLFFLIPKIAWAKPKQATLQEMIANSHTIVVSRFLGEEPDKIKRTILGGKGDADSFD